MISELVHVERIILAYSSIHAKMDTVTTKS